MTYRNTNAMHVRQGIQMIFVFSSSKNIFYPNQTFHRLDFSLLSNRVFDNIPSLFRMVVGGGVYVCVCVLEGEWGGGGVKKSLY